MSLDCYFNNIQIKSLGGRQKWQIFYVVRANMFKVQVR